MTQTDFAGYVRTMVRGDDDANDRIEQQLDQTGWAGWPQYLAAAFFLSVDRHFKRPADAGEIVRFVALIRAGIPEGGPEIDQPLAERMIRSVLDDSVALDMASLDQEMVGKIQTIVTYTILSEPGMTDADLDTFLDEASRFAARI